MSPEPQEPQPVERGDDGQGGLFTWEQVPGRLTLLLLAAVFVLLTVHIFSATLPWAGEKPPLDYGTRVIGAGSVAVEHLSRLLWPAAQGKPWPDAWAAADTRRAIFGWLVVVLAVRVLWRVRPRLPEVSLGGGWMVASVLPLAGVLPLPWAVYSPWYLLPPAAGAAYLAAMLWRRCTLRSFDAGARLPRRLAHGVGLVLLTAGG